MNGGHGVRLDANERVRDCVTKAAAITWSYPADRRLDQLVDLANEAGANTRRNELAAALVAAASREPDELLGLVLSWRRRLVREVVLDVEDAADVVELPRHPPGRRRPA